jgi:hypothetical protein
MNSENLSALGSIGPPSTNHDGASPFDTFAVNLYGDVALLDVDGRVRFSTLGDTSGKSVQDVPVDKIDELLSCKFTNIEFNEDGTILLLWSSKVSSRMSEFHSHERFEFCKLFFDSCIREGFYTYLDNSSNIAILFLFLNF